MVGISNPCLGKCGSPISNFKIKAKKTHPVTYKVRFLNFLNLHFYLNANSIGCVCLSIFLSMASSKMKLVSLLSRYCW